MDNSLLDNLLYHIISKTVYEDSRLESPTEDKLRTVWKWDFVEVLRWINGKKYNQERENLIKNLKDLLEVSLKVVQVSEEALKIVHFSEKGSEVVQDEQKHTDLVYDTLFALTDAFQECKKGGANYCGYVKKAVNNVNSFSGLQLKIEEDEFDKTEKLVIEEINRAGEGASSVFKSEPCKKVDSYLAKLGKVHTGVFEGESFPYATQWLLGMTSSLFHAVIPEDHNNEPKELKSNALLVETDNDSGVVVPAYVRRMKSNGLGGGCLLPDPQMIFINMSKTFFDSAINVGKILPKEKASEYNFFWRLEKTKLNEYPDKISGSSMGIFLDFMCRELCETRTL